jgi:hypothetical protein
LDAVVGHLTFPGADQRGAGTVAGGVPHGAQRATRRPVSLLVSERPRRSTTEPILCPMSRGSGPIEARIERIWKPDDLQLID